MTVREHVETAGGADEPQLSPALEHIWGWYNELSGTRSGGFGPKPINHQDIMAWSHNTCSDPSPWEVAMILKIDQAWLKFQAAQKQTDS